MLYDDQDHYNRNNQVHLKKINRKSSRKKKILPPISSKRSLSDSSLSKKSGTNCLASINRCLRSSRIASSIKINDKEKIKVDSVILYHMFY